jgi:hypothetical protein
MLTLSDTILLVGMETRHMVRNTNGVKKELRLIFVTPICLHGYDFAVEYVFNIALKFFKELNDFRFSMKEINPCEFDIIINETNLILLVAKGLNDKTQTSEKIIYKRCSRLAT